MEQGYHIKNSADCGGKEVMCESTLSIHCPTCQGILAVNASKKVQVPVCERCNNDGHWVMLYRQTNGKK